MSSSDTESLRWRDCCGHRIAKQQIVYCSQLSVTFVIVVVALLNLTFANSDDTCLWTTLIGAALGYLVPNPTFPAKHESIPPDAAVEQLDGLLPGEHSRSIHDETEQHD